MKVQVFLDLIVSVNNLTGFRNLSGLKAIIIKYLQIIILIALQYQLVFAFEDIYEPDNKRDQANILYIRDVISGYPIEDVIISVSRWTLI
jgi:hypothetical protein